MSWTIKEYSINQIFLDSNNIRLSNSPKFQDDIIKKLFDEEDAFTLVKSIVNDGIFEDEFPLVVKENGKFIVIEGNRRIAAIKAINNPDLVPDYKSKILKLKPERILKIRAVLAPNRDVTNKLVANKHTKTTRKSWPTLRQAYFYKLQLDKGKTIEQLIQDYPDQEIKKYVKMLEAHKLAKSIKYENSLITKFVHDEKGFPITNLERMYVDDNVTDYLKLTFDENGKIKIKSTPKSFKKAFKQIIEDIYDDKINSRTMNTSDEKKEYINSLPKELKPELDKKYSYSTEDFKEEEVSGLIEQKKERSKRKHKGLIPSYVPFKLNNNSLRKMYDELREIDVEKFSNATHDLLRSFLECSLVFYLKETDEYKFISQNSNHNPKLSEMLNFLTTNNCKSLEDDSLKELIKQIKTDYNQQYSVQRMNMINHNPYWASTENEVRGAWNKLEELMKYLLNPKKPDEK
jgi:hypothetical protein